MVLEFVSLGVYGQSLVFGLFASAGGGGLEGEDGVRQWILRTGGSGFRV